jgi:hypothetical protein
VLPVRYELGFYIPEDGILYSHSRENLKSYRSLIGWALQWRRNVFPVRYDLGSYIPKDGILQSHRHESLISYICCILYQYLSIQFAYLFLLPFNVPSRFLPFLPLPVS